MRHSNAFLGAAILAALLILVVYGIAALSPVNPAPKSVNQIDLSAAPLDKPTVSFGNPSRGPKDAAVTVFVFGDYVCPPCAEYEATTSQLLTEFPKDVRIVWKDMPNTQLHPESINAAVAARCAADQGAFWQYHDLLYQEQASIGPKNYTPFAAQLGLDLEAFQSCYDSRQTQPLVQRDYDEGQRLRVDSTPYTFVNGRRVAGAVSYEQLRGFVVAALSEAGIQPAQAAP
ncbi:MAG TPA: thioredoxin domain-containing protein [Candidatus Binatia bacterium]|jgi:protein-disulfide isomerase|nr:thioredoxin domain-containing protein [Candidatus Binatia bacterium]